MREIKDLRIIYFGTPDFSASLLKYLVEHGFNVVAAVTKADAYVGRNKVLTPSPVKVVADTFNIKVFSPVKLKHDYQDIIAMQPDLILTFAYGQILPLELLQASKYTPLNFHGSLLPKHRGASPIQMALINQDKQTGVTLMEMVMEMDAGRMFAKALIDIEQTDNFDSIASKMVKASIKLIEEELVNVVSGVNRGETQNEAEVSFAPMLKQTDEQVNFAEDSVGRVLGKLQAFAPKTGVKIICFSNVLSIYAADKYSDRVDTVVGTLFIENKKLILQLIDGQINIISLQKVGKNIIDALSFINGERSKLPAICTTPFNG